MMILVAVDKSQGRAARGALRFGRNGRIQIATVPPSRTVRLVKTQLMGYL